MPQYGLLNRKPPEKLIEEAKELGRRIDIPEPELRNIEYSNMIKECLETEDDQKIPASIFN